MTLSVICCKTNIHVQRYNLSKSYKQKKILFTDLKSAIKGTWKNVKVVDISIVDNEYNLHICCDDILLSLKNDYIVKHQLSNEDESFIKVTKELNDWNIGSHVLDKINILVSGVDNDSYNDIDPNKSISLSLGIPISRITEFYCVKRL